MITELLRTADRNFGHLVEGLRGLLVAIITVFASPVLAHAGDEAVPQESIVRLEDGVLVDEVLATYNATLEATVTAGSRPQYLFGLPQGISETQFLVLAEEDERIKDARLNFTAAAPDPSTQSFFFPVAAVLRPAQATRPGIALTSPTPATGLGHGVIVAVVDTGVDSGLVGFGGGAVIEGVSFVPNTDSADDVGDGVDSDGDGVTDELVGHGTFVASIIQLVAPESQILPIRVLDADGRGNMFRVAQGIEAAILHGAQVINISLGSTADVDVVGDVIEQARLNGITVVASVGNDGSQLLVFPAARAGVIAVGAVDSSFAPTAFSNFGPHVTMAAAGVDLVGETPSGTVRSSGTSFATALVSGTVAAMLSVDPELTPTLISDHLAASAASLHDPNGEYAGLFGSGVLDIRAALAAAGASVAFREGDLNLDFAVDLQDLNLLLGTFGNPGPVGDADGNGEVNLADLNLVLSVFGTVVP
jgi:hypothetical protein